MNTNKQKNGPEEFDPGAETGDDKMSIDEACKKWNEIYPGTPVTAQTIRNWAKKFGFGQKSTFLPRSKWEINEKLFNEFIQDPKKFLTGGAK